MSVPGGEYIYDLPREDPRAPRRLPSSPSGIVRRRPAPRWLRRLVWGLVIAVLIGVGIAVYIIAIRPAGVGTSLVAFTAALVPVSIVLLAVWWLDRYTPQPRITLVYAFAWGGAASVALSLLLGPVFLSLAGEEGMTAQTESFLGAVVQAPIVEEATKSLGLLLLLVFGRRFLAGPLDGVVYAVLIAGGFAFTENILYFANSFHMAQAMGETDVFWQTFFLRGLLSPFAHASFTALAGLGLGIAAERRSLLLYLGLGIGGLAAGMCLHALWNGATFLIEQDPENPLRGFLEYYAVVQVPIFLVLAGIVIWLRLRERRIIRRRLADYGRAGWYAPAEITMLLSLRTRRRAEKWAGRHGALARTAMRGFISASVQLALERQRVLHGRPTARTRAQERALLEEVTAHRRMLGALSRPVVPAGDTRGAPVH
ncbi:MAG: PrsW family intramembrane metalloprotease [Brachybacterium sp.]|nr:PrsW family intramembrane metalloprotease [Brachybacterium sp.]